MPEEIIESWLPDLTDVSFAEIMNSQDPLVLAAINRIVAERHNQPSVEQCENPSCC